MKKYILKTCLMAIVACFCLSLASCSKSPEQISKEADELINNEGSVSTENIDKALDLYEVAVTKAAELSEKLEESDNSDEEITLDNPLIADAMVLANAGTNLRNALSKSELSEEQSKRLSDIESEL